MWKDVEDLEPVATRKNEIRDRWHQEKNEIRERWHPESFKIRELWHLDFFLIRDRWPLEFFLIRDLWHDFFLTSGRGGGGFLIAVQGEGEDFSWNSPYEFIQIGQIPSIEIGSKLLDRLVWCVNTL